MRLHPCTLPSALTTARRVSDSLPPCCLAKKILAPTPAEAQRSGFGGKRRKRGTSELTRPRGSERYGAASDVSANAHRGRGMGGLSLERQAERLSDIVGQAQPPLAAVLRAAARTHFVAKSAPLGTPSRASLDCAPLLLGSERKPLRWVSVRVRRGKRKTEGGKNL